jgi:hypothetical protein
VVSGPEPESTSSLQDLSGREVYITIVDNHLAEFWKQVFQKIVLHPQVAVRTGGEICFL